MERVHESAQDQDDVFLKRYGRGADLVPWASMGWGIPVWGCCLTTHLKLSNMVSYSWNSQRPDTPGLPEVVIVKLMDQGGADRHGLV